MTVLVNHPDKFLNDAAAASLERLEDDHGVQPITSAGRTLEEGKDLLRRWNLGGTYNRPPFLYEPANPPETSEHYKKGGNAVDTTNWQWWREHAGEYGWIADFNWDVVHFGYHADKDQHINRAAKRKNKRRSPMNYLRINGKPNARRGGTYVVFAADDGSYVAEFIGDAGPTNLTMVTDEAQIARLQKIIRGLA